MAEFNDEKLRELVTLLSVNKIRFHGGFAEVMNADYSSDPSRFELVCQALERIRFLALDCVNHGKTGEKKKDIAALSKLCVKLTKNMNAKKAVSLRMKIDEISAKEYVEKHACDVRGGLVSMLQNTTGWVQILLNNGAGEKQAEGAAPLKEVLAFLNRLTERIENCYDNYSAKAAEYSRSIFEIVFKEIRALLGSESLTSAEFEAKKKRLEEAVSKWEGLKFAGQTPAKEEDTYGFNPNIDDSLSILGKKNDFLEKLSILERKLENYNAATEKQCDVTEERKKKEALSAEIASLEKELGELQAKADAGRISVDEALRKAEDLANKIEDLTYKMEDLDGKIQDKEDRREGRESIYEEVKEIAEIIEASRDDSNRLYLFVERLDLKMLTEYLTGIEDKTTLEEKRLRITTTKDAAREIAQKEHETGARIREENRELNEQRRREREERRQREAEARRVRAGQTASTQTVEETRRGAAAAPAASDSGTTETVEADEFSAIMGNR